jgi:citrate synthase
MDVLKTAVAVLASFDSELNDNSPAANLRKAIRLTAKFPTIVAAFERLRTGEEPISPDPQLDHAANFLYMLSGTQPTVLAARAMDASLILHMEHEMNASTFACTVTASTLSDLYSAVISGLGTLKGPLHGGANEQALKMLQEIESPATAERFVLQALSQKRKLPGFGHRVYKAYDPRARIFKDFVKDLSDARHERRFYEIAARVETVMIRELGEAKGVFPNIDFYSGIVYQLLGIPMDLFTPIFAMARVVGWTAHVMEYLEDNRLVRPRAHYIGPLDRAYIPMELRGAVRPPEREPPVSLLTPPV